MLTTLTLKRAPAAMREPCAWFLPGGDPAEWLRTASAWPEAAEDLVFYPVPGLGGSQPVGVLVVPRAEASGADASVQRGRALPYGRMAEGLYAPTDGVLWPPVEEAELRALLRHRVQVWHPVCGLCGFDEGDALRAWDLLVQPASRDERWNFARAVEPTNTRLRQVRMVRVLSLEDLFGEENKDIGSEPAINLPRGKDEPKPGLPAKLAQGAMMAGALGAKALLTLTGLVPRGAGPATWVNHLENWAQAKSKGANEELERARNRELHRLLEMIERDPAKGLRHAISLADLANRGRAAPSGRLGERSLDFNMKRLGGGGPADAWNVPEAMRASLAAKYREAAQRETALGRHRRAACIFAELLGDFSAAAEMLKRGRFFAEAAVLYRERLRNEVAEAECLAEGGLFDEAITIHERRGRWPEVAVLQERAGRPESAREAWRREVGKLLAAGDRLGAARLLETRLHAPEEALAQLAEEWPGGKQALQCLVERFAMLGRRHDHAAVGVLLEELTESDPPERLAVALIGHLAGFAETLTHEANRQAAAEAVRARVSVALSAGRMDGADEMAALRALTRIEPQDRLLKRDVLRFREGRPKPVKPVVSRAAVIRRIVLVKQSTISLPRVGTWLVVKAEEGEIHAVARTTKGGLFFTRGAWSGALQSADWEGGPPGEKVGVTMARVGSASLALVASLESVKEVQQLPASDAFGGRPLVVGTWGWLPDDIVQLSAGRGALWVLRLVGERVVLASYVADVLAHSRDLTEELKAAGAEGGGVLCLEAAGGDGRVALAFGRHLVVVDGNRPVELCDVGGRVRALIPAPAPRFGWVALLERGVVFVDAVTRRTAELDDQMEMPLGAILGDGRLLLVGRNGGKLVEFLEEAVVSTAWFEFKGADLLAVTRAGHPREFIAFDAKGTGQRWQVPG